MSGKQKRQYLQNTLISLYQEQNGHCYYCNIKTYLPQINEKENFSLSKYKRATVEHLKPLSHQGTHDKNNLVMACCLCNSARSNLYTPEEYKKFRQSFRTYKSYVNYINSKKREKRKERNEKTLQLLLILAKITPEKFEEIFEFFNVEKTQENFFHAVA